VGSCIGQAWPCRRAKNGHVTVPLLLNHVLTLPATCISSPPNKICMLCDFVLQSCNS
jgi:hypothetical protein